MDELHKWLQTQIRTAQDKQEVATNRHRTLAPSFQVGDIVFLNAKNIRTSRNSCKLDWERLRPFAVKKVVSLYAYELELPLSMK